ncbi:MAG: hypothetical protein E6560_13525 [Yersiniaceae bacterium]|nr:hypothetical protein [Yersiniaceae bacterium]
MRLLKNLTNKTKNTINASRRSALTKVLVGTPLVALLSLEKTQAAPAAAPITTLPPDNEMTGQDLRRMMRASDGLKSIGRCSNIRDLRNIEPTIIGQKIDVASYHPGWSDVANGALGGGEFWYDAADTASPDDGGRVIVTKAGKRWKRITDQLLPSHFGCVPGGKVDVTENMRRYINACRGGVVDFTNGPWLISGTLDLTNLSKIVSDSTGKFMVDTENFHGDWAIQLGDPKQKAGRGRCGSVSLDGILIAHSHSRSRKLNGIYMKGSWLNIGHVRAENFNGIGIYQDSVWDSTTQRLSAELCGNISTPQIKLGSNGDTHNASHIVSIQSEQAYHYSLYIDVLRDVIDNIHAERTYILTNDDGSKLQSNVKYRNAFILLGNSIINHAVMDAATTKTAPDGTPVTSHQLSVNLNADYGAVNTLNARNGILCTNFGHLSTFDVVACDAWYFSDPVAKLSISDLRAKRVVASSDLQFTNCVISEEFELRFNAKNVTMNSVDIGLVDFTAEYQGDVSFSNCHIKTVKGLGKPKPAFSVTVFRDCRIDNLTGANGSRARFYGGFINTINLASGSSTEFYDLSCGSFGYQGSAEFITRGVRAQKVSNWAHPQHVPFPAGTTTDVLGPIQAGQPFRYINVDGKTSWRGEK